MKPEAKSENTAPVKKAEAEISTSVGKTDSENSVPASKAAVSLILSFKSKFLFKILQIFL